MGIEEKTVRPPRVRLDAPVQIVIPRHLGQMTTMFLLKVLLMFRMFCLNVAYPGNDSDGYSQR